MRDITLSFRAFPQPDDTTCGPTCLCAVYHFFDDEIPLSQVVRETPELEGGGTLGVHLACHALRRGYAATIYSYNLRIFDPSWFKLDMASIGERLRQRAAVKTDSKLRQAIAAYIQFIELGGRLRFSELTLSLVRRHLRDGLPVLAGLSATYLYHCPREIARTNTYDDIRGDPSGHFVVICGYRRDTRRLLIADPLYDNPTYGGQLYHVSAERLTASILLGVLTYDANLIIIRPR